MSEENETQEDKIGALTDRLYDFLGEKYMDGLTEKQRAIVDDVAKCYVDKECKNIFKGYETCNINDKQCNDIYDDVATCFVEKECKKKLFDVDNNGISGQMPKRKSPNTRSTLLRKTKAELINMVTQKLNKKQLVSILLKK